ncbi:DNA translocase FtsK [Escherichia coli]|nr:MULTISPECIES: DNA translocase FtsK [Escherichia]EGI4719190.1 hypothetical protein [Escherichia coli]EGO5044349.1 hypothetical protein [Escherichia coli]EGO6115222.1 hypothetical protein [Escherichia coli]EGO6708252.1 hypothetical protein [Escherichia coli]EGO6740656.1 hypothetical protein [Escherichia coli]
MMKSSGNNSQTLSGLPENSGAPFADYEYRLNELYPKAVELAEAEGIISISRLQRKFRIGWNTAATLKEKMEELGVLHPIGLLTLAKEDNSQQKLRVTPEEYGAAVNTLAKIALTETSGGRAAAQVLLSAWNGYVWQLDIPDLCYLDYGLLEQALIVIRGRVMLMKEPQEVIPEGNAVMKRIAVQWRHLNVERRGEKLDD